MKSESRRENYTYIVKCSDSSFYTGWTNNLEKRIQAHNDGKGAKYTKSRRPVMLAYYEKFATKEEAMSREYAIKKLSRKQKEKLILEQCAEGEKSETAETKCSMKKENNR